MKEIYNFIAKKEDSTGLLFNKWSLGQLATFIDEYVRDLEAKNNESLHLVSQRTYFFDCWNVGGKTFTKEIKATCKEHAILKFEKEYDSLGYDEPYVG